jgi:hypothetical protein
MAADTIERTAAADTRAGGSSRRALWGVLLAASALALGLFGGWLIWSGDDASTDDQPSLTGDFPVGQFEAGGTTVDFKADGTCEFSGAGWTMPCTFSVNGDLFTETTFDYAGGAQTPATYYWTFDDGRLSFELWGDDPRPSRQSAYTILTWTKVD